MKNIDVIEAPSNQSTSIEVKNLDQYRADAAKVLGVKAAESLTYDDFAKVIGKENIAIGKEAEQDALAAHETEQRETIGAPSGFPETADVEKELNEAGPVVVSLRDKIMYQLGRPMTFVYGKMYDKSLAHMNYFKSMSAEEQQAHKEKVGRRSTLFALGAAAIYGITKMNPLDMMPGTSTSASPRTVDADDFGGTTNATVTKEIGVGGNAPNVDKPVFGTKVFETADFEYNHAEDPALSPAKKGNDFGPALQTLPTDAAMKWPSGMTDLINNRMRNSPEGFAAVMSKFGLVDNNANAINSLAEQMKSNPDLYKQNYNKVMEMIATSDISERAITVPYGSYYAVKNGNDVIVAYDNYVDHGGTAIVFKLKNGTEIWCREDCGGVQPVDLKQTHTVPAQPVQGGSRPQGGGQHFYNPPRTSRPPVDRPPIDRPPIDIPPTDTEEPPEVKGEAYPTHPNLTTDLGPGEFMAEPVPVETERETSTGRDIGGGAVEQIIRDTVTNQQGSQSGAQVRESGVTQGPSSIDTSSNAGSGSGVGSGDESGPSNNSEVSSR